MRAAKIDANQNEIVDALRAVGASVQSLAKVGGGCPDLLVGIPCPKSQWFHNVVHVLIEVKDPVSGRMTPAQKKWHSDWPGRVHLVETVKDAMQIVAHYREFRAG